MTSAIVSLIILALSAFWCIRTVNDFKKKEIRVQEALSGIEVALTKRYDKLVKMLDIAKGYMTHESELFTKVIELRHGMSIAEMNDAQRQMDTLSVRFFAVAENYPELRSSSVLAELQRSIRDAEEHLQAARRLYNTSVTSYNTAIAMFPAKILAGSRQPKEFFAAEEDKREDVKRTCGEGRRQHGRKSGINERTAGEPAQIPASQGYDYHDPDLRSRYGENYHVVLYG